MKTQQTTVELRPDANAVCERCGKSGAFEFDGRTVCMECYAELGSCCPEFGADDLTCQASSLPEARVE